MDKISLAYWFPILEATRVPVPKTEWWNTDADFWPWADGQASETATTFMQDLRLRAERWGYPLFLRTGHTSAKHSWRDSCFVESEDKLKRNVWELIEFSLMQILDLPLDVWVIRELLDLDVRFSAFWENMPISQERRFFIKGGSVLCEHPYWPPDAFENVANVAENWRQLLEEMNASPIPPNLKTDSEHVSAHFDGAWSLDWARHKDGTWYAIDMAPMEVSYHWPGCPNGH
ncbi:MAG TPA: ATP-grasp domain-containing protein [Anaerolineales bacterium]|nr:ATP-grasp domain-containing protein [Anaerolineales bacterium]